MRGATVLVSVGEVIMDVFGGDVLCNVSNWCRDGGEEGRGRSRYSAD